MEIRELKYFLAVANLGNLTKAAEYLYITQPNLTRQMQNLERELGKPLFIRGNRHITLTAEGLFLKKRAEEILDLYDKTAQALQTQSSEVSGEVCIGGGESHAIDFVAKTMKGVAEKYPNIKFNFYSGDTDDVAEKLDKGLLDFGVFVEPANLSNYNFLRLPKMDIWGVIMRGDSPLAELKYITPSDLRDKPLLRSKHSLGNTPISNWFGVDDEKLNIVATYNLIYNASIMVEQNLGYAIGLDHLIDKTGNHNLCFKPLFPTLNTHLDIVWKKQQVFSKPASIFLQALQEGLAQTHNLT